MLSAPTEIAHKAPEAAPDPMAADIRDATDRMRVQGELIQAREAAERAREVADRANQEKSRFLATASHDLRQPLQTLSLLNGALPSMSGSGAASGRSGGCGASTVQHYRPGVLP